MQDNATQCDTARVLTRGTRQGVDQGGFAGAVAPQQSQSLTSCQCETDLVQHHSFAITRGDVFELQHITHELLHDPSTPHAHAGLIRFAQAYLLSTPRH